LEDFMFNQSSSPKQAIAPRLLIRGCEEAFLAEMEARAMAEDLELDLGQVERIDAAGIGALVKLRGVALAAGRRLSITSASRRAAEILHLVGLDSAFQSRNAVSPLSASNSLLHPAA